MNQEVKNLPGNLNRNAGRRQKTGTIQESLGEVGKLGDQMSVWVGKTEARCALGGRS